MPLHKKGDKSNVKSYRPISLICVLSKLLEAIIYKRVIVFLSPFISSQQFGLINNCSCLSQPLTFLADIYYSLDCKTHTDVIYFNFKQAFDSLPHNEVLLKLWSLGITSPL